MVLGGVWCPDSFRKRIARDIRDLKVKHGLNPRYEMKWNKISKGKLDFYIEVVEYFFSNVNLHFRGMVIPDKSMLRHVDFCQTHDDFYYKCYFSLIKTLLQPGDHYNIYLDIKDTRGETKVRKLHDYLCKSKYDFNRDMIRSHELELVALADVLIGALSYVHRGMDTSNSKLAVIEKIKQLSGYTLLQSTLYREDKFNIFVWHQSR